MGILQLFLDSACAICDVQGTVLCRACERETRDRYVGVPASRRMPVHSLARTDGLASLPVFAAGRYDGDLQRIVLAAKRSGHPRLVSMMAALVADSLAFAGQEHRVLHRLTLVPLHSGRQTRTAAGTDLVLAIAVAAARELRLSGRRVSVGDQLRVRPSGASQKGLRRDERERNVAGKYRVGGRWSGQGSLVLFDDVMTTGASVRAADSAMIAATRVPTAAAVIAHRLPGEHRDQAGELSRMALEGARYRPP